MLSSPFWIVFCFLVSTNYWIKGQSSHPLLSIITHLYLTVRWAHQPNLNILWFFLPWGQKAIFKVSSETCSREQDAEQLCIKELGCDLTGERSFLLSCKAVLINNWTSLSNSGSTGLFTHTILFPFLRETLFPVVSSFSFYHFFLSSLFTLLLLLLLNENINNSYIVKVADS